MDEFENWDDVFEEISEEESEIIRKLSGNYYAKPTVYVSKEHFYWNRKAGESVIQNNRSIRIEISKNYIYFTLYEKPNMYGTFAVWKNSSKDDDTDCYVSSFPSHLREFSVKPGLRLIYKCKDKKNKFAIKRDELYTEG